MILYHVTHRSNVQSILAKGIDPSYSRGRTRQVWLCSHHKVAWALDHVSERDGVDWDDLAVLRVEVPTEDTRRTRYSHVYTTPCNVRKFISIRIAFSPGDLCHS